MNTQVKVYHHGAEGLVTRVFDIYTPDANKANPVEVITIQVRDGYVEAVDALGQSTVLDNLETAERVVVCSGTNHRVIWPESAINESHKNSPSSARGGMNCDETRTIRNPAR